MGSSDAVLARRAISCIDLTNLDDHCGAADIDRLCDDARKHAVAAVCVWPDFVASARHRLGGSAVRVATVVNFPTGDERASAAGGRAARAEADGADEVDVVLPYRAWLAGDLGRAADVLDTVRSAIGLGVTLKVIIESGELGGSDTVRAAARFAIEHGADMVKTSTGKTPVSATPDAVAAIVEAIIESGRDMGVKASGGIRTFAQAAEYLDLVDARMGSGWATPDRFRFGASGLLTALIDELGQ
ncbi:MAG: deoxyribose-phosphate aldolase [Ilumatobacteraceae bacterium]